MTDFRVEIRVDARTKEQAIAEFEKRLQLIRDGGWQDQLCAGGGGGGSGFGISIGQRTLSVLERIERLERGALDGEHRGR